MKKFALIVGILLLIDLGALWYIQYTAVIPIPSTPLGINSAKRSGGLPAGEAGIWERMIKKDEPKGPAVKITFLDIGQGDASYIQFPNGEDMLIDCAADARILGALGRVMRPSDRTIDYLVISHAHADHYGGCIDVMKRFTVKHIWYNGYKKEYDPMWRWFWEAMQTSGAEYKEVNREERIAIASSTIHILYPDHRVSDDPVTQAVGEGYAENNMSIVMTVQYGPTKALFTGDMEKSLEEYLIKKYGREMNVDILKAGHHGSPNSSNKEFLSIVTPHDTVISVGKENKYGHPSPRVLKRLDRVGSRVWRTDRMGLPGGAPSIGAKTGDIVAVLDGGVVSMQISE